MRQFPRARKKAHNASIVKTYKGKPAPPFMIYVVQEFLELLYWKFRQVLDRDGISMLQWAFIQRAFDCQDGVSFSRIIEVTGESKDHVRRAAASLEGFATVNVDPEDRRARRLVLTKRGRSRARIIMGRFEKEMFKLLGARDERSQRVKDFKYLLWDASAYLVPGDLASEETIARSKKNLRLFPDDSLRFVEEPQSESMWIKEERPDDWIPF
jgi:DNA-binding MarR family transcriptional regulator